VSSTHKKFTFAFRLIFLSQFIRIINKPVQYVHDDTLAQSLSTGVVFQSSAEALTYGQWVGGSLPLLKLHRKVDQGWL
jgi:hypothetical protein